MASAGTTVRSVFAPVPAFSFSASQFEECRNFLEARSASTESVPVVDEAQLVMAADGRITESGYRFNPIGFRALSSVLSVGLSQLFNELSGENVRQLKTLGKATDIAAAVSVYNTTLRVRFDALRERNLLVNHRERTIEGFLGLDHRMLDNSVFLETVRNELHDKQPAAEFFRAELLGRELRLYFIDPTSRRTDIYTDPRHTFAAGWYFSNREDTGNAIRASTCLYTKFGVALSSPGSGGRLNHTGADLVGRTAVLAGKVSERVIDMNFVAQRTRALTSLSLEFSDDRASMEAANEKWLSYLMKFKIPREDAKQIIKNTTTVGADIEARDVMDVFTKEVLRTRTAYDLFCSILRCSRGHYHTLRDQLQTTALQILLPETKSRKRK
jgi:hypothetical protein